MRKEFAVKRIRGDEHNKVVIVDTKNATYKGLPWKNLGTFGKRKFENLLVIENHHSIGGKPKIIYE